MDIEKNCAVGSYTDIVVGIFSSYDNAVAYIRGKFDELNDLYTSGELDKKVEKMHSDEELDFQFYRDDDLDVANISLLKLAKPEEVTKLSCNNPADEV